jgi:S1-C subfamily serine protease
MSTSLTLIVALTLGAPALKDKEPPGKGPGYVGITFQKDEGGLIITEVKPESPALKAGLRVNDVIVKVEGASMKDADTGDFVKLVGGMRPGTIVALDVQRGTEMLTLKVKLGARPADFTPTPPIRPPVIIDDPRP